MATEWIDADFATVHRLAMMLDAEARGEGIVTLRREIRYLEDAFGLNPASRARLRWQIGPKDGAEVRELSVQRSPRAGDSDALNDRHSA